MYIIDTHCHLDALNYDKIHKDPKDVLDKCEQRGVKQVINISCSFEEYKKARVLLKDFDQVFFAMGIHPSEADKFPLDIEELRGYLKDPRVVAIGEIGLDSYWTKEFMEIQYDYFRKQLALAKELDLPVIIHTRGDIAQTTIDIIRESGVRRGVVHCFTENQSICDQALELGFYIGVGGISTFKNAEALREVLRTVPLNRILTETDSPYLAPVPNRGKENQPAFVADVVNYMSAVKGVTVEEFCRQTTQNARDLFKLPLPEGEQA